MKYIYRIIKIIILLALLVVALKNTQLVSFNWLFGTPVEWPLIVLLLIFFVIGTVFGIFAMLGRIMTLRHENVRLRNELKKQAKIRKDEVTTTTAVIVDEEIAAKIPPIHP